METLNDERTNELGYAIAHWAFQHLINEYERQGFLESESKRHQFLHANIEELIEYLSIEEGWYHEEDEKYIVENNIDDVVDDIIDEAVNELLWMIEEVLE